MFTMLLAGGEPIYEQLERRITELILNGEMAEGEKLPAVREVVRAKEPDFCDIIPLSLEEIFIYEIETLGYDRTKLM